MQNQEKRIFEVTGGQIWAVLIIAALALTIVFEVGVWVGKKRVINAEREAARQNDIQMRADARAPIGGNLPYDSSPDKPTEQLEVEKKEAQYTVQVGTFRSRQNAENLVKLLESYEYRSWLKPEPYVEETLYSVFVGRFDTRDEAEQFGRAMRERLSYVTGYMVRKIQG